MMVEKIEHRFHNLATGILEIHIDAIGTCCRKLRPPIGLASANCLREPKLSHEPFAFLMRPGDTYNTGPAHPCDLPGNAAHGTRGCRYYNSFAAFGGTTFH